MVVPFFNGVFNEDGRASGKHALFSFTVFCHANGLAHVVFILESALFPPPLLSSQTQTLFIVIFLFCHFRKLDGDILLFVEQPFCP